jgi:N-acetylneuraminate synthase/N,N'-diacetyllegionaminate synthase
MKIGTVDLTREVLVVAEIGNNHEGDLKLACEMIVEAARAGAGAVKFQSIVPEYLVARDQSARLEQLRRFQLSESDHHYLADVATNNNVMFLSSPFSVGFVDVLSPLVPAFKIASGDNDYVDLLNRVASTGKPVLLSTGMTSLNQVAFSVGTLTRAWSDAGIEDPGLVILHCVSAYPTPAEEANLGAIHALSRFGRVVGYSDHTLGIEAAVLSVALGARVIEKHFTLSKTLSSFRDHQLSAEPQEFKLLVDRVKEANILLGDGNKRVMPSESTTLAAARRSVCAARDLVAGSTVGVDDLICLRPGGGLTPGSESRVLGRRLLVSVSAGHQMRLDMVQG